MGGVCHSLGVWADRYSRVKLSVWNESMIENSGHAPLWAAAPHQAQVQAKPPVKEVRQSTGSDGATGANVAGNPHRGAAQPARKEQIRLPPPLPDLSRPSGPPPAFEMSVLEVERAMRGVPEAEPAAEPPKAPPETPEVVVETPELAAEAPELAAETPEVAAETPEVAAETPEVATEVPEPPAEVPEAKPSKAAETSAAEQAVNEIREIELPEPQPDFDEKR